MYYIKLEARSQKPAINCPVYNLGLKGLKKEAFKVHKFLRELLISNLKYARIKDLKTGNV